MMIAVMMTPPYRVALLAEGVGRNSGYRLKQVVQVGVALLAEGVGRNYICWRPVRLDARRPPRGGRG